jgi:GNAT superfamily N-acetyltransferase
MPDDDDLTPAVALMAALHIGPGSTQEYRDLRSTMRQTAHLVAWTGDEPVGFGFAGTWPGGEECGYLDALLGVLPEHRNKGIGSSLVRALERHASDLDHAGLQVEVPEDEADAMAFFLHRGYAEVGRELQFELDLTDATPPPFEPPDGVEIVPRVEHPELVRGMYDVALDAVADIPGVEGEGGVGRFEDWYAFLIERPGNRPDLCFVAVHGSEVVGTAALQVFDGGTVHHDATRETGVARTRRRSCAHPATDPRRACGGVRSAPVRDGGSERADAAAPERLGYRPLPSVIQLRGPHDVTT